LQYFSPAIPGDGEFYRQLTQSDPSYYNAESWDFEQALRLAPPGARLLDVACGAGAFVELAAGHGLQAQGIDTNPEAVSRARSAGLSVELSPLDTYSQRHAGEYGVVTAFQVLEHLGEVVSFTRQAAACLQPGGLLLISVPNRRRLWRDPQEPLDCPPHHLSRWEAAQFGHLAELCDLRLCGVYYDHATVMDCLSPLLAHLRTPSRRRTSAPSQAVADDQPNRTHSRLRCRSERLIETLAAPIWSRPALLNRLGLWRLGMLAALQVV
jgi:SAM-dependent methyltransferase